MFLEQIRNGIATDEDPNAFLYGRRADCFEALQQCLVPMARHLTPDQKRESRQLINRMLRRQPAKQRLKLRLFFLLIEARSFLKAGRSFHQLSDEQQCQVLRTFFDSSVDLLRKGFGGVNTLAKMSVYGQESVHTSIHYQLRELKRD